MVIRSASVTQQENNKKFWGILLMFLRFFKITFLLKNCVFPFKAVFSADVSAEPDTGADGQWRNTSPFHIQLSTATGSESLGFESLLK